MAVVLSNVGYDNILFDLSFEIKESKITFIVGESGCGKSVLLSLINGDLKPTNGYISSAGKISILRQNFDECFFCNTVYEEILYVLKKNRVQSSLKKIIKSLKIVGLDESYLYRSAFDLSKGEQKRVAIATILALNPSILLLDEPFNYLDSTGKKNLIKLFRMMKIRYNKTIIIASSDTDMALSQADEVICLKNGHLLFKGNKYDLFTNTKLLENSNLDCPKLIQFTNLVKDNKGIDIGYRDDISDLMKDIYRFVK